MRPVGFLLCLGALVGDLTRRGLDRLHRPPTQYGWIPNPGDYEEQD